MLALLFLVPKSNLVDCGTVVAVSVGVDAATGVCREPPLFGASAMTALGLELETDEDAPTDKRYRVISKLATSKLDFTVKYEKFHLTKFP